MPLRGVEPGAFKVHRNVKIVEGRTFEPGRNEIIAGRAVTAQFTGLRVGSSVRWGENTWQVVGIFEAGGSAAESELWCDAKVLQPAYRRGNTYQSVYVRLASHDSFDVLKDALTTDPYAVALIRQLNARPVPATSGVEVRQDAPLNGSGHGKSNGKARGGREGA